MTASYATVSCENLDPEATLDFSCDQQVYGYLWEVPGTEPSQTAYFSNHCSPLEGAGDGPGYRIGQWRVCMYNVWSSDTPLERLRGSRPVWGVPPLNNRYPWAVSRHSAKAMSVRNI